MTSALDRVESMLDPGRLGREPDRSHGYLDVLAPESAKPTGLSNALMHNPAGRGVREGLAARVHPAVQSGRQRHAEPAGPAARRARRPWRPEAARRGLRAGLYTKPLARKLSDEGVVVGLDVSEAMLQRAVRDNADDRRVAYVRGSALDVPFADGAFDTVACLAALYLIPAPRIAVREICRVTKPGGRVALFTSLQTPLTSVLGSSTAERVSGFRWFGKDEITGWLREYGLVDVQQTISGQGQFVTARKPQ
ncbi:similarity with UbiE/COQ5 methyltransferase [Tsukamurella sp. PLM1]|nr:similarity with UbiE/COQ5 methyltransferase [Tsukamurella sp. PLM1]